MSDVKLNPEANIPTLKTLLNDLTPVNHKWHRICIQLGIPNNKLREFEKNGDPLVASLDYWLNGNTDVPITWESVVAALESPSVGELGQAKVLKKKYWMETIDKATKETIQKKDEEMSELSLELNDSITSDLPKENQPDLETMEDECYQDADDLMSESLYSDYPSNVIHGQYDNKSDLSIIKATRCPLCKNKVHFDVNSGEEFEYCEAHLSFQDSCRSFHDPFSNQDSEDDTTKIPSQTVSTLSLPQTVSALQVSIPPSFSIQSNTSNRIQVCAIPECFKPRYVDDNGTVHECCGYSHAMELIRRKENKPILTSMCEVKKFLSKFSNLSIVNIEENDHAKPGGALYKKFIAARQNLPQTYRKTCLAFHGTSESNITSICANGYDPKRRAGQAYGCGEYFYTSPNIALGNCKGGKKLLLNELLLGQNGVHHTLHSDIIVMKIPEHDLPRFIITFK